MYPREITGTAAPHVLCQEGLPFRQKGLPFGLKKPKNGIWHGCWECSTSLSTRSTTYYTYTSVRPVVSQNRPFARKVWGFFGMRVIFPCRRCVQQSSHCWTAKPYFEVFRKQQLMFPSGNPLSGHQLADKPLKTINGHPE